MKALPTLLLCIAGAGAGTGLGWLLRGAPAQASAPDKNPAGSNSSLSSAAKTTAATSAKATGNALADELSAELSRRTGAMRWLYLLGAADKATPADMPHLLRAAESLPGAKRMLAVRWAELDPRHMFNTLSAEHLRRSVGGGPALADDYDIRAILFEEWAKKDVAAATAALGDLTALPGVEGMRHTLSNTVMKSDPALGLRLMSDWSITSFIPNMDGVAKWAARDPRAAAEAAFTCDIGHATDEVMQKIGKAWAATDPAAALAFAAEKRGLAGIHLSQAVLSEWASHDLQAAIAHVTAQDENLAKSRLGLPLIETWAKSDPQAALLWADENLQGEARASAAASIVKSMASKDINEAATFIAGLEPGSGKTRAVNQLMETWLRKENKEDATAALAWMASLPDAETRRQAMEQSSWRLFYAAADETTAFLKSPQGATAPQSLFDQAARHLAQKNPESAMQWVGSLPADKRVSAQSSVLSEWVNSRPEAAKSWTLALPAGEVRSESIAAMTAQLGWQSTGFVRDWLKALPPTDHAAALKGLKQNGAFTTEVRTGLEALVR